MPAGGARPVFVQVRARMPYRGYSESPFTTAPGVVDSISRCVQAGTGVSGLDTAR
jgi:hypothetical protein